MIKFKIQLKGICKSFLFFVKSWTKKELSYMTFALTLVISMSVLLMDKSTMTWSIIGIVSSIFGIIGTMSTAKKSVWNYLFGLTHIVLYGASAYNSRLYGDFMLNYFFFIPTNIIGIFMWKKHQGNAVEINTKRLKDKQRISLFLASIIIIVPYWAVLQYLTNHIGGGAAWLDSTSTVLSIFGMFLMIYRYSEQWLLWMVVNTVSILMWAFALIGGDMTAIPHLIMWSIYLINSIWGWLSWENKWVFKYNKRNNEKEEKSNGK